MRRIWNKLIRSECEHQHTLLVTSVGIRRSVCEDCGHISFAIVPHDAATPHTEHATSLGKAAGL